MSITAPAEGAKISGSAVTFDAAASDSDGSIAKVEFLLGTTLIATDTTNSYHTTVDTTKYANGTYTLTARATDNAGAVTTAQRSVTIENVTSTPTTGPTVSWKAPAEGGALSGNVQGPPNCVVDGANIAKVMFYINGAWTNTDGNLDNGLGCWIDTTKYKDGAYTLKAVAYNAAGQTAGAERSIMIHNAAPNTPPTVSFKAPTAGATLSGSVNGTTCEASATDDKAVSKVDFYVGKTLASTKTATPWQCAIDTTKFSDGPYTLMAVATDSEGASATAQVDVSIKNAVVQDPPPAAIDAADIIGQALADVPFAQQSGYNGQVLGQYPAASSIPETGINGTVLPNGETLRLGKETDPTDSTRKALVFQLDPGDPDTSGSKRAEIKYGKNIEMEKTYWAAFKVFVPDWGTLETKDIAIFGTQLHSGDNSAGYSPSLSIVTGGTSGRNFKIQVRGTGLSSYINYAEQPIPFGRWVDFVFKVRQSTGSTGLLQAWMDGNQIVNHSGPIGYKTAYNDYFKFGYYNWSRAFSSSRKVLLRSVTIVADPTGGKYDAAALRAFINQ